MTSSAWALQTAVRALLEADAGLIAVMGNPPRIYDHVPDGAALPYVRFGDWKVDDNDTDDARIDSHVFMIEVASSYAGLKQAKAIAVVIEQALHGAALSLDGYMLVDLSYVAAAFGQDRIQGIAQASLRFRALTQAS